MLRFRDPQGREWEAVVGRESWGAFVALFMPLGPASGEGVRQTALAASRYEEALLELDALDSAGLLALWRRSAPKTP